MRKIADKRKLPWIISHIFAIMGLSTKKGAYHVPETTHI